MGESDGNERGDSRSIINIHITALAETRAEEEQAAGDAAVAAEPKKRPSIWARLSHNEEGLCVCVSRARMS